MRTAIIIHGNLRTFFMPIRGHHARICDVFKSNVVDPNSPDLFLVTDTTDFFFGGAQYFASDREIETVNNDSFRLHDRIEFTTNDVAKDLLDRELRTFFGSTIKHLQINVPYDHSQDDKFKLLKESNAGGYNPALMVQQYRKIKLGYTALLDHEKSTGIKYDVIMKTRFDNLFPINQNLHFGNYDFQRFDVYIPSERGPIIHDWFGFGNRKAMDLYLSLYDRLGFTLAEPYFFCECPRCHNIVYHGPKRNGEKCDSCNVEAGYGEITLASEYNLYRTFKDHGIRVGNSGYPACPFRYKDTSNRTTIEEAIKNLQLTNVKVKNFAGNIEDIRKFE